MRIVMALCVLGALAGCARVPPRPSDPAGFHREGYAQCEELYSKCLAGSHARETESPQPVFRDEEGALQAAELGYGHQPSCVKSLKRCYHDEALRPVGPLLGQ